jgi:FkbM family methyltransferase
MALRIADRAARLVERLLLRIFGWDQVSRSFVRPKTSMVFLGSPYGGWTIPDRLFSARSICYCVGVGEDITFDLALIRHFDSQVFAFDPTPRAITFVDGQTGLPPSFRFMAVGLWNADTTMRFYEPKNPSYVSHSIVNLKRTEKFFEAPCRRLSSLMNELGHRQLDLLKLDIEGAEYQVIDSIIQDAIPIRVLCVEFDETNSPLDRDYRRRIRDSIRLLGDRNFYLAARSGRGNFTFINSSFA